MRQPVLDERLSLAAALYEPCTLGADIGTDHALLPCYLLEQGVCKHMILADVSPNALAHAQEQVSRRNLENRATLRCADGLDAIDAPCGCISAMGMGGDTLSGILRHGSDKLQGAVLVLSAHTEPYLVRQTLADLHYHIVREELTQAAGRYYVFWRAEPGDCAMSPEEIRYGNLLYTHPSPHLPGFLQWRMTVLEGRLRGMQSAAVRNEADIALVECDLAYYRRQWERLDK